MSITETTLPDTDKQHLRDLWEVANKAGVQQARENYDNAIAPYEAMQAAVRETKAEKDDAKQQYTDVVAETELIAGKDIERESNKTYLLVPVMGEENGKLVPTGKCDRRQITADEAKNHIAGYVKRDQWVLTAAKNLKTAEAAHAEAVDQLAAAEKHISHCKYDLQAATQILAVFTTTWSHQ